MTILTESRASDSPYVELITRGQTLGSGSPIRPSETHWHMVFVKVHGSRHTLLVGPWTSAGVVTYNEGADILWIQFKLGTFMPHLPTAQFLDNEINVPESLSKSFWLHGSAWECPTYENVETFVHRLAREDVLTRDPLVNAVLDGHTHDWSSRTVRHRFLHATGLTQSHIRQAERARQAELLLRQGVPILDTVYQLGYTDQPHLTKSLKRFIGKTPAQV